MRILHISDLHLGRQFFGLSLEADHQSIFDQVITAMLVHLPDVLIIAGDLFDRASPPASAVKQFNTFLSRVATETTAAVVMIAGNHDSGDRIGAWAVTSDSERFLVRGPLLADEEPLVLRDAHGSVAISALPFGYEYAARECFGDETFSNPEAVLRAQLAAARARVPVGARWVVVAHAFVEGANPSESERPLVRVGSLETVGAEAFEGAHYVALGHLHRPQEVGRPSIRYSGAPLAFGFDEEGSEKSMTLLEMDASGAVEIQTLPLIPLRGVRVVTSSLGDLLLMPASDDFIRVVLTDKTKQIDPMRQAREIFPNACQLVYARDEQMATQAAALTFDGKIADPFETTASFVAQVRGESLSEAEAGLLRDKLGELTVEETSA
jgi:DNA repair protein SbcD/Mre11